MAPAAEIGVSDLPADLDAHSGIAESVQAEEQGGTVITTQRNASGAWESGLGRLAVKMLQDGHTDVFDALTSRFEKAVVQAA